MHARRTRHVRPGQSWGLAKWLAQRARRENYQVKPEPVRCERIRRHASTSPFMGRLQRVLGPVFGLAVSIGITVGVGGLRRPGEIARQVPSVSLYMAVWLLGGVYALFGALSLAELGAMLRRSGGQYVAARHTFGPYIGFVVGWNDWVSTCG